MVASPSSFVILSIIYPAHHNKGWVNCHDVVKVNRLKWCECHSVGTSCGARGHGPCGRWYWWQIIYPAVFRAPIEVVMRRSGQVRGHDVNCARNSFIPASTHKMGAGVMNAIDQALRWSLQVKWCGAQLLPSSDAFSSLKPQWTAEWTKKIWCKMQCIGLSNSEPLGNVWPQRLDHRCG